MFIVMVQSMKRKKIENDSIRVLLVDDEMDYTAVLSKRLSRQGLNVCTANDGGEAFSMIERNPYDVVVLDIGLPDVNGMQLLKAIKKRLSSIEVIMLSGVQTSANTIKSWRAGAFDFLSKPACTDMLTRRIIDAARAGTP